MNKLFLSLIFGTIFLVASCAETTQTPLPDYNFYNDQEDYYTEYSQPDEDVDDTSTEEKWDIEYTFYGIINDASVNIADMTAGDGSVFYTDKDGNRVSMGKQIFALKKFIYTATGKSIPLIQIFFLSDTADGDIPAYVLQIEGSSLPKDHVFYLNNNKIYRAVIAKQDGKMVKVCFDQDPKGTNKDGYIQLFTHSIRTGEVLSLSGKANMQLMDPIECHNIN